MPRQTFSYDAFGNIKKTVPGGYGGTAYAAAYSTITNQVSSGIRLPTPSYDANGNQLASTPATLTWNALNQPVTVNSTSATYDALGRMVERGLSGVYTQFVYRPSGGMLAVYSGALSKGTISLPAGSTAVYTTGGYNGTGLSYIRHKDWLGSSRLATTWQHGVYSKEAYAPFGETYNEAGTPDRSFTGQDQNVATGSGGTGTYDFLFRKYDPSAGRWLSPDPAGWAVVNQADPQSLDRYAYVENQPMTDVDAAGLDPSCISPGDDGCTSAGFADGEVYGLVPIVPIPPPVPDPCFQHPNTCIDVTAGPDQAPDTQPVGLLQCDAASGCLEFLMQSQQYALPLPVYELAVAPAIGTRPGTKPLTKEQACANIASFKAFTSGGERLSGKVASAGGLIALYNGPLGAAIAAGAGLGDLTFGGIQVIGDVLADGLYTNVTCPASAG